MSSKLLTLPDELLIAILRMLDRDLPTLRSVALVSHRLLPAAREELFRIVDADILKFPSMRPFLVHVEEICLIARERLITFDLDELFLSAAHPRPDPQSMPKFRAIHLLGYQGTAVCTEHHQELAALPLLRSVRELSLYNVLLSGMHELCLFPNLQRLAISMVYFITESPSRPASVARLLADNANQPRLVQLRMGEQIPSRNPVPELARWLLQGPSRDTLKTLIASFRSRETQGLLSHFGPTIEHLALPLRELHNTVYNGYLGRYANLRTLCVFLGSYNMVPGAWYLLPSLLTHMPTTYLQTLTIDIRLDYPLPQISSAIQIHWKTLDRVNDALDEDKFSALREVEVVVQWKERLGWEPEKTQTDVIAQNMRERLYHMEDAGKLAVTVQGVKEFWDSVPGPKG
ncbi:hypothetical protein FKP32DRAFT_1675548 [Trametes sanguinea]|nr:hypothetical protein FKP32DRAFT_1675548 [Trametes sanguinea]